MSAATVIEILLRDHHCSEARGLIEASVHRPRRGQRWIASFRDEAGRQRWKSTGLTDRNAAFVLAKEWEAAAQRQRGTAEKAPQKALIRVRGGSGKGEAILFTQREVAALLSISERAVRSIERRAIEKLRRHPALRQLWREWTTGEMDEGYRARRACQLNPAEITAVYGLAQTPAERELLRKLLTCAVVDSTR